MDSNRIFQHVNSPDYRNVNETASLLSERNTTHGDFEANARVSQQIKVIICSNRHILSLSPIQQECLDMIALKISRIVTGNPNFKDHWDDIAGYATLAARECGK